MRIGFLGGGQLARMMALAGTPLGLEFSFLDPAQDACAGVIATPICGAYDDLAGLDRLADSCDLVTFEFENVPAAVAARLADHAPVFPPPRALAVGQDRLHEKRLFGELGIPTAPYRPVESAEDLTKAAAEIGLPALLKTRTQGYDGKGQRMIRGTDDLTGAWEGLGSVPCILEGVVPFEREVSMVAVRGRDGEVRFYPLNENTHRNGILYRTLARPGDPLQASAEAHAAALLNALGYVGVIALELFVADGQLLANEFAPRVHNTGHWTIEGSVTSQFENHLRAICGLPLGDTSALGQVAMINLIGELPDSNAILAIPGAHLHLYGKAPRPGRKIGHVTIQAEDAATLQATLATAEGLISFVC